MKDGMTSESLSVDQIDGGSIIASVVLSGADLATGTGKVGTTEIEDASIVAGDLASSAVVAAKIGSGAVTQDKLGSAVVGAANIAAAGITAANIGSNVITADRIAAGAIGTSEQGFVGTGSPPAYSGRILYGSSAMPSATSEWIVFGDTFAGLPSIAFAENVGGDITITGENAGSFLASGTNATIYHWIACGSV